MCFYPELDEDMTPKRWHPLKKRLTGNEFDIVVRIYYVNVTGLHLIFVEFIDVNSGESLLN